MSENNDQEKSSEIITAKSSVKKTDGGGMKSVGQIETGAIGITDKSAIKKVYSKKKQLRNQQKNQPLLSILQRMLFGKVLEKVEKRL